MVIDSCIGFVPINKIIQTLSKEAQVSIGFKLL